MDREYTEKYVAFIDILGFKSILKREGGDASRISRLFDSIVRYKEVVPRIIRFTSEKNPARTIEEVYARGKSDSDIPQCYDAALKDMVVKIISDSIILAIPTCDDLSFTVIVDACSYIAQQLLNYEEGFFVRGAITKGLVYFEEESVFFGDAYVRAYMLEEHSCIYPRIIYEDDYVEYPYANSFGRNEVSVDEDGWGDIDYIGNYLGKRDDCWLESREKRIKEMINREIRNHSMNPDICAKYYWVKSRIERARQLVMAREKPC